MAEVVLTNGGVALVDDADLALVQQHSWYGLKLPTKTYVTAYIEGKPTLLQRFLVPTAKGHNIRFKNGNALDCRRENLDPTRRKSTRTNFQRGTNRTSRYEGVSFHKGTGKYISRVHREGKQVWLGSYGSEVEAFAINRAYHSPPFTDPMIAQRAVDITKGRGEDPVMFWKAWDEAIEQLSYEFRSSLIKTRKQSVVNLALQNI